jgi:FkbM family methyltransferase
MFAKNFTPDSSASKRLVGLLKNAVRKTIHLSYHLLFERFPHIYEKEKTARVLLRSRPPLVKLVNLHGVRFGVYIEGHGTIEDSILRYGDWSGELLALSDHFILPNSAIIEVGANIGFESLYYATKYPDCLVLSYEPASHPYASLLRSKAYNRLNNLQVFKLGVGDNTCTLELATPTAAATNKGLGSMKPNPDLDESYTVETVSVVTLDCHYPFDPPISLIKIDTQGFELNVLKGASALISKHRPVILFEHEDHYHQDARETKGQLADFFDNARYHLYVPSGDELIPVSLRDVEHFHGDLIALPLA